MRGKITLDDSTDVLLDEWGKWANAGLGLGLGSPVDYMHFDITDDIATVVDGVVAKLKLNKPLVGNAIVLRFRENLSFCQIAHKLQIGETQAKQLEKIGLAWADGCLDGIREQRLKVA